MSRRNSAAFLALAAAFGAAGTAFGLELEVPRLPPGMTNTAATATSSTQRFVAHGPTVADDLPVLTWAERVAERVEKALGRPLPFVRGYPLRFFLRVDPALPDGVVTTQTVIDPGGISQRIQIRNPGRVDPEDVLEALCALLTDRLVLARADAAVRERGAARAPAWFSVGLAQYLYPQLRARDGQRLRNRWTEDRDPRPAALLALRAVPAGRSDEKAAAGVFFEWLHAPPDFPVLLDRCLAWWGRGEPVDADRFAREGLGLRDARAMDIQWDLWVAALADRQRTWGLTRPEEVRALRERLAIPRLAVAGSIPAELPALITPDVLVAHADDPWVAPLARRMMVTLLRDAARGPDLRAIAARYEQVLAPLSRPRRRAPARWFDFARRPARLRAELAAANAALAELERRTDLRNRYLDNIEHAGASAEHVRETDDARSADLDVEQRARLLQYLDAVERRAPPP